MFAGHARNCVKPYLCWEEKPYLPRYRIDQLLYWPIFGVNTALVWSWVWIMKQLVKTSLHICWVFPPPKLNSFLSQYWLAWHHNYQKYKKIQFQDSNRKLQGKYMLLVSANQGRCRYGRQTNADVFGQKQKQKMFLSHRKQIALCFFLSAEGGFYGVGSYFRMGPAGPLLAECSPHVHWA